MRRVPLTSVRTPILKRPFSVSQELVHWPQCKFELPPKLNQSKWEGGLPVFLPCSGEWFGLVAHRVRGLGALPAHRSECQYGNSLARLLAKLRVTVVDYPSASRFPNSAATPQIAESVATPSGKARVCECNGVRRQTPATFRCFLLIFSVFAGLSE